MITLKYNNLEITEGYTNLTSETMLSSPSVSQTKDDNMNNNNNNMTTRKWTKQNVQKVLRQLRGFKNPKGESVFEVTKTDNMYEVKANKNGQLVFSAMNGRFDYLVRFDNRLFNAEGGK